jgi:hypothetical protein
MPCIGRLPVAIRLSETEWCFTSVVLLLMASALTATAGIKPSGAAVDRVMEAVVQHHAYPLCFACLAKHIRRHGIDVRQAAQIALFRDRLRLHIVRQSATAQLHRRCIDRPRRLIPP